MVYANDIKYSVLFASKKTSYRWILAHIGAARLSVNNGIFLQGIIALGSLDSVAIQTNLLHFESLDSAGLG